MERISPEIEKKAKELTQTIKERIDKLIEKYKPLLSMGLEIVPPLEDDYMVNDRAMFIFGVSIGDDGGERESKLVLAHVTSRCQNGKTKLFAYSIWEYDGDVPLWVATIAPLKKILATLDAYDGYIEEQLKYLGEKSFRCIL